MKLKRGCRLWWLVIPLIVIDRITKLWAVQFLAPRGVQPVLRRLLSWAYVENRGMAFGMASGSGWILIALTALLVTALLIYLLLHPEDPALMRAALWMVIGGGLGNLWDRIAYGFVVDFIRLDFIDFPVFNCADIFVCLGAGLAILAILLEERRKKHGGEADFED